MNNRREECPIDKAYDDYHRFLDGDDNGFVEIIKDYKDGLILYLFGITGNIYTAEELAEETFIFIRTISCLPLKITL